MWITKAGRIPARRTGQRAFAAGLMIAAGVAGFHHDATAQTIQNGSFSNAAGASSYVLTPGTSSVPSWTYGTVLGSNAGGCMVVQATYLNSCANGTGVFPGENPGFSPNGGNFLSINVDLTENAAISQTLAGLIAGTHYTISFYQASINNEEVANVGVEWLVSLGGTLLNPSPTVMHPAADGDTPWTLETISFTATQAEILSPTLRFLAQSTLEGGPPIALLDGIQIQSPEPASMTLLGFGVMGLVGLRRRRARASV